jgi:hypothetical protein
VELQKRNECIDLSEKNSRMSGNFFVQILFRFENVGRNTLRPTNFLSSGSRMAYKIKIPDDYATLIVPTN